MSERNDGGPAFPVVTNQYSYGFEKEMPAAVSGGMTLRDYFAAKAVAGLMARNWSHMSGDMQIIQTWAKTAYAVADEMLKARDA